METNLEKEVENKIRIYIKNQHALLDTAALAFELKKGGGLPITLSSLMYRLIETLQDEEIKISYKGKAFINQYEDMLRSLNKLSEKYCNQLPQLSANFQKIRSIGFDSYLYDSDKYLIESGKSQSSNYKFCSSRYNIIELLIERGEISWIRQLITSENIPLEIRCEMLDDIISNANFPLDNLLSEKMYLYPDSIYPEIYRFRDVDERKKHCNQLTIDLLTEWSKRYITGPEEKYELIRNCPLDRAILLQEYGIIDFTNDITYIDESNNELAILAKVYEQTNDIYKIKAFYEAESYSKLSPTIRKNTDSYLIKKLCETGEINYVIYLINLKGFKINSNNIAELITSLNANNITDSNKIEMIYAAIEEKAVSSKEYRKAKVCTATIKKSLLQENLENKRQELVAKLAMFNDYLQDSVPGKTKIKNIASKAK